MPLMKNSHRRLLQAACILLAGMIIFVALIRTGIFPPLAVLEYQLQWAPRPAIGGQHLKIKGWGWYPMLIEEKTPTKRETVTFARFLPFVDPSKRPITFMAREEILDNTFFRGRTEILLGNGKNPQDKCFPRSVEPLRLVNRSAHLCCCW